jgi:hypothetical protein
MTAVNRVTCLSGLSDLNSLEPTGNYSPSPTIQAKNSCPNMGGVDDI